MKSPEAALGIYLMKCGDERPVQGIQARHSGNRHQFTVVKGNHFMQVNNYSGEKEVLPAMVLFTRKLLRDLPKGNPIKLLNHLPQKNLLPHSEMIILGPFALQSIFTFGRGNILQIKGKVFGVAGDYKEKKQSRYTGIVLLYPDKKAASAAFQNLIANLDPYLKTIEKREKGFIFKDFRNQFGFVEIGGREIEIKVNLSEKPLAKPENQ